MIEVAERTRPPQHVHGLRFLEGDAAALPVPDGSCDLVTLVNMIPFFDELDRVLSPDGTLLVSYSEGAATPIWVPPQRLERELARRGFASFTCYTAGAATCLLARKSSAAL